MPSLLFWLLLAAAITVFIWLLHRNQHRRARENAELNTPLANVNQVAVPDFDSTTTLAAARPEPAVSANAPELPIPETKPAPKAAALTAGMPLAAPSQQMSSSSSLAPPLAPAPATVAPARLADHTPVADNWLLQARSLREGGDLDAALALCRAHFPRSQAFQQAAVVLRQQIRDCVEQLHPAGHLLRELYHTAALADLFRGGSHWKPAEPQDALARVKDTDFSYASLGHQYLRLLNKGDVRALEQLWGQPATHRHAEELLGEHLRALSARPPAPPAS